MTLQNEEIHVYYSKDYYGRRFKCKHLNENCTKNIICISCVLKAHKDIRNLMAQIFI
jgi:hypothetical protein